jgi:hypothetical protein
MMQQNPSDRTEETPRITGIGEEMMHRSQNSQQLRWSAVVTMTAAIVLIVSAAGAADRVVLGEYFTNLF